MPDFATDFINSFHVGRQLKLSQQQHEREQELHDLRIKAIKSQMDDAKLEKELHLRQLSLQDLLSRPIGQGTSAASPGGGVAANQPAPDQQNTLPEALQNAFSPQIQQALQKPVQLQPLSPSAGQLAQPLQQLAPNAATPGYEPVDLPGITDPESGRQIIAPQTTTAAGEQLRALQRAAQAAAMQPYTLTAPAGGTSARFVNGQPVASVASPAKLPEGETPLGPQRIAQLNAISRQVLPGAYQLYQLGPNATQKDADRLDKLWEQAARRSDNEVQRGILNEARKSAADMRQQAQQDREEQNGLKWVEWTDPATGKGVAGPLSMAHKSGATDASLVPTEEIRNIKDARQVVNMVTKKGSKPEEQGIIQLIDSLEKDGKLGVAVSRLNSFMAGKVGAEPGDDPRIMALLNKSTLAASLSMKSHFGASGGRSPQMLQHFLDMANAKTMNANTLRAGTLALADYMKDRAKEATGSSDSGISIQRDANGRIIGVK